MEVDIVPGQFDDAEDEVELTSNDSIIAAIENSITTKKVVSFQQQPEDEDYDDYDFHEDEMDILEDELLTREPDVEGTTGAGGGDSAAKMQPMEKVLSKYIDKISVDNYASHVTSMTERGKVSRRVKDKSDRATIEQVLDPRTRIILFKMLSRNVVCEVNGVISTGKEANVYHATTINGEHRAIKIYKTSILTFKDRDRYVTGEFRFRRGYCKGNPRKMVTTWAEKEARNLTRMKNAGVNCPTMHMLRGHVLVMDFIGSDGWPAPLLKDVKLTESKYRELYLNCVLLLRRLYHDCKLVHADLSEFNLLYDHGHVVVIDVSQSVEHDHPHSLEFLRKDCTNINDFFRKNGVPTMSLRELFDFVTDVTINKDNIDQYLDKMMTLAAERTQEAKDEICIEDEIFKQSFIPRTLDDVDNFERDVLKAKKGLGDNVLYKALTGMNADLSGAREVPEILQDEDDGDGEEVDDDDVSIQDGEDSCEKIKPIDITVKRKNMTKEEKKLHKKQVKEENRERRTTDKIPKHVKKRQQKLARLHRGK